MQRLRSQFRRITAKPAGELAGRVAAIGRERFERWQHARGRLAPADRLERALGTSRLDASALLAARRARRPAFFPSLDQREAIRRVMAERYPAEVQLARTWADRAQRHEFHFFGQVYRFPAEIPWHDDPGTRRPWPARFYADTLGPRSEEESGDVKDVCELSRQQFLVDLGKAYFLDGSAGYSAESRRLVLSWIAGNPYATGINWASPLEPAYRTFSWLWAYYFTFDDPDFNAEDHVVWLRGFLDNGRFLHRHLELYASPFNHLIGEATALYLLGTLFPEFREAGAWRARGRAVLEQRLPQQFYADGGTVEQATLYHHATLGFYLLAALVGRANRDEFSSHVWTAIERAIEFSMLLVQPDGQLPAIGDTDDARPVQLERKPFFDFRAYQTIGAVLFGRGDFKAIAGRFHEDALWLLGVEGMKAFDRLEPLQPDRTSVALPDSGYFVSRSDWTPQADYVCFDCGEQAGQLRTDDVPSAAHGHADCLSVIVFLRGQPVLVDSGFYTYNGGERWERAFRQTAAHNTARVDSRNQARHLGKMAWSEVPLHRLEDARRFVEDGCVVGSHDGFMSSSGVRHRRFVWHRRDGGYVVLFDDFEGPAGHEIDVHFHFAPMDVRMGSGGLTAGTTAAMYWTASFPVTAAMRSGGDAPEDGWIAPSLGVRVAAPAVRLAGRTADGGAGLLTVLAPAAHRIAPQRAESGLALSIEGPCWRDDVTALPSRPGLTAGGLTITRRRAETIVEDLRIAGLPARRPADHVPMPVKVLQITSYPPPRAGWGVRVEFLKVRLESEGHVCTVLNIGRSRAIPSPEYETVVDGIDYVRKVWRFARDGYLVHMHGNGDSAKGFVLNLLAEAISLLCGRRSILTFHAGVEQMYFPRGKYPLLVPVYWLMFALPQRIICNSEAVKAKIMEFGVPASKIVPIPAFSSQYLDRVPTPMPPAIADFYARLPKVVFTYIRIRHGFYLDTMIEGFARVAAAEPGAGLAICGVSGDIDDELLADMNARIARHQLADRICLIDDLNHDEFLEVLTSSALYLRTPTTDGVASSVLESLALGVPVVGSENGSRPPGVITYEATDAAGMAVKVLEVMASRDEIAAAMPRPPVRDTLADEVLVLTT